MRILLSLRRSWRPAVLGNCATFAMVALAHCSSEDPHAEPDGGSDASAAPDGAIPKDVSQPDVLAEAGPLDDGGAPEGAACSAPFGTCGAKGGSCCSGLSCVNQAFCCVSAAGLVTGNCTFPEDCCSGHCQDSGSLFGVCCRSAGQVCKDTSECCNGLVCSGGGCR